MGDIELLKTLLNVLHFNRILDRAVLLQVLELFHNNSDLLSKDVIRDLIYEKMSNETAKDIERKERILNEFNKHYASASRMLEYAKKVDIHIVSIFEKHYPYLLKQSSDCPPIIYIQGKLENLLNYKNYLSVIGSRKMSFYGKKFVQSELPFVVKNNISIVSGLARGIDIEAHKVCLNNLGFTIACLAHGLNTCYPREHKSMKEQIAKEGLLLSEFPLGVEPRKHYFPVRNRIISALSQAILVVEARTHSGTLITTEFAAMQGREVLAVPGSVYEENSNGCNRLIRDGATPVINAFDILDTYHIEKEDAREINVYTDPILRLLYDKPYTEIELANILRISTRELRIKLLEFELEKRVKRENGRIFLTRF